MLTLNLQNVESLVFFDRHLRKLLPTLDDIFREWKLGKRASAYKHLSRKAIFDFFDKLDEEHLEVLKDYFKTDINVIKTDYRIVKNISCDISCANCELNEWDCYDNLVAWRDADQLYISSWR